MFEGVSALEGGEEVVFRDGAEEVDLVVNGGLVDLGATVEGGVLVYHDGDGEGDLVGFEVVDVGV